MAMNDLSTPVADPYLVKKGETLTAIAKRCGRSVADLMRYNKLSTPNKLDVGQTLYLTEQSAFGVSALFLDALRHPIANLSYQLRFDGKTVLGSTDKTGTVPRHVTRNARSSVEVWVCDAEQQWQRLASTVSGYGHKLITLVSGDIVIKGRTETHPPGAPVKPEGAAKSGPTSTSPQAPLPKPAGGTPSKNNPAVKTTKKKAKHGQSIMKIEIDIPQDLLKLFTGYTGEKIIEDQWIQTAKSLDCEVAVLKAIADVETKGAAFRPINLKSGAAHVPTILYERHKFRDATNGKYNEDYPDLSGPRFSAYGSFKTSYLRLINAYRLDADAALMACSWGKFQIMGDEWKTCKLLSVERLVRQMCIDEPGQLQILAAFIRNKAGGKLGAAVKAKDWPSIALYYNGAAYADNSYDVKMKNAYEKHKAA
jgi:LysM repeat protein